MKDINVGFVANNGGTLNILFPQNYSDQTILALGTAYRLGKWTLRGGARIATQAVSSDVLLAVVSAIPRKHVSLGFSYDFSVNDSVGLAYSHAFKETTSNTILPNTSAPIQLTHSQDNLVIAYTRRFLEPVQDSPPNRW